MTIKSFTSSLRQLFSNSPRRKNRKLRDGRPSGVRQQPVVAMESLEQRLMLTVNIGASRPDLVNSPFLMDQFLDNEPLSGVRDSAPEIDFEYGFSASHASATQDDTILAGDFSGLGFDQVVAARDFAGAIQWLGDTDRDTDQEYLFRFGLDDMTPLIADMNGDGFDDIIAVDTTTTSDLLQWYVHYWDASGATDYTADATLPVDAQFSFGLDADNAGTLAGADIPLVGDFNGDGFSDVAVARDDLTSFDWYIGHSAGGATPWPNNIATVITLSTTINDFGANNDIPVADDWDNDGDANIGVVDEDVSPSQWNLDTNGGGAAELTPQFGLAGDQYYSGNWADVQWDGSTDGNWSNPSNWSGGVLPGASDDVLIDTGDGTTVTVDVAVSVGSLEVRNPVQLNADVTTTGIQSYSGAVTLGGNVVLTGTDVTFGGTVDGAFNLTVNASGTTTFADQVGSNTSLASLTTDAGGTTVFGEGTGGANVLTATTATFNNAVIVDKGTARLRTTGNLTFNSTLDAGSDAGGEQLILEASGGTLTTAGDIGSTTVFSTLQVDNTTTSHILGGDARTTGLQGYNAPLTVSNSLNLVSTNGPIDFNSTVDGSVGSEQVFVNAFAGTVTANGLIGSNTQLGRLRVESPFTVNAASITTGIEQQYEGPVTLATNTTVTASDVFFNDTLDGAFDLTVNSPGTTTFGDQVGINTPLASLTTDAPGTTEFGEGSGGANALTATTATFNDPVIVDQGNARLRTTGNLTFNSTVDAGSDAGGEQLILEADGGILTNSAAVGSVTAFSTFQVDGVATVHNLSGDVTTTGIQVYGATVTLGANSTMTSSAGGLSFDDAVNGAFNLTLNSPGETNFTNGIGTTTPLASITTDSIGSTVLSIAVNTTGDQNWNEELALGGNTTLTGAALTMAEEVTLSDFSLTADMTGTITVGGDITGTTTGDISLTAERNIVVNSSSSITVVDGDVTLSANQQAVATSGDFHGVNVDGSIATSGSGDISISGRSGNDLENHGVRIVGVSQISSTATGASAGTITINGTSVSSDRNGDGVVVTDITSTDGAIQVVGVSALGKASE